MKVSAIGITLFFTILACGECSKKEKEFIEKVYDVKEFKKLLRTRTNVLVLFMKSPKAGAKVFNDFNEAAKEMKGKATVCSVDCGEAGKLCKKMKASPNPLLVQHFQDGEYHKVYDRSMVAKSIIGFLEDPTGDVPWDEDETAGDVIHISTPIELQKLVGKSKKPILTMFYAPWCGHCKRLKPEFAAAASESKATVVLAGINADKPALAPLRESLNISGYPTLFYFKGGQLLHKYGGEYNKAGILNWLENPSQPKEPEKEEAWSDKENDVHHLTTSTFEEFLSVNPSVLVMFYAPWCGHCKAMKPDYEEVATTLKNDEIEGKLAAVDATESRELGDKYSVKGFPTVIYFKNGEQMWTINERSKDKILEFMKNPEEPAAPPAPELPWSEVESDVFHLTSENFQSILKKRKHSLIMFYAPWCGHCKKAKPHFTEAAAKFADDPKKMFAAVDCTENTDICAKYDVSGYPTFQYMTYGKNEQPYSGGREGPDFIAFMTDPENPQKKTPPPAEDMWVDAEGAENVVKLTDVNFDNFISSNPSVLVMFYAPWCGHCKRMKPDYAAAATQLKEEGITGILAALDSTLESSISSKYEVKGFPSLKYFKDGKFAFDFNERSKAALVGLMKDPVDKKAPPKEDMWAGVPGTENVHQLTSKTFNDFVAHNPSVLVMFYAPWCGHCMNMKPAYAEAATLAKTQELEGKFAAVDCTQEADLATKFEVKGFPTLKYFLGGKDLMKYSSGRDSNSLLAFIKSPLGDMDQIPENAKVVEPTKTTKEKEEL